MKACKSCVSTAVVTPLIAFVSLSFGRLAAVVMASLALVAAPALAAPVTTNTYAFLMIGMGNSASTDDAINVNSSEELGANKEFLATSNPNTRDVFYQGAARWASATEVPLGAKSMFVGTDYSGNLAVTSSTGKISLSNIDVYSDLGVQCSNSSDANCTQSISNTTWQQTSGGSVVPIYPTGIFPNFDSTNVLAELQAWDAFLANPLLLADYTINADIIGQNDKDSSLLDVLYTDGNNDGLIVIDIDRSGSDFKVDNSDWIIDALDGYVIFRVLGGSNVLFGNSSILAGDSGIDGILFWHSSEAAGSSDTVFSLSNVILNDVALWDLNKIGDGGSTDSYNNTSIVVNNAQGCAQFVSQEITMNDVRWTRCAFDFMPPPNGVPEPGTLALLGLGLAGLAALRRRKR